MKLHEVKMFDNTRPSHIHTTVILSSETPNLGVLCTMTQKIRKTKSALMREVRSKGGHGSCVHMKATEGSVSRTSSVATSTMEEGFRAEQLLLISPLDPVKTLSWLIFTMAKANFWKKRS